MKKLLRALSITAFCCAIILMGYPLISAEGGGCQPGCQNCIGPYKTMVEKDCPGTDVTRRACVDTYSQQVPYETFYCCQDFETSCPN